MRNKLLELVEDGVDTVEDKTVFVCVDTLLLG